MDEETFRDAVIADFVEHLVPEAFQRPTRAYRVTIERDDLRLPARDGYDEARFEDWVEDRLADALQASWPHDRPLVVAYTSDGRVLRRYEESGCGHLDCVVEVVRDEVVAIETPWVFGAWLPRPQPSWRVVEDDGNQIDEVLEPPAVRSWQVFWLAEARRRGLAARRMGVVEMDGEVPVRRWPTTWEVAGVASRAFDRMLYQHPARRRHPIRRPRWW